MCMQIQTKCWLSYFLMSESFIIRPLVYELLRFLSLQFCTAVFAVYGFKIMPVAIAAWTFALFLFLVLAHHCGRNYTGRNGYNGVTYQHYHC